MKRNRPSIQSLVVLAFGLAACGAPGIESIETEADNSAPLNDRLNALQEDLLPGSQGEGVRTVQDFLTASGYFPNAALAAAYPEWRAIVSTPPNRSVYDEHTLKAVRALQANSGLAVTGIVDQETRTLMQSPRCGVPDGIPRLDPSDKFYRWGSRWPGPNVLWKVRNTVPGLSLDQVTEMARQAFAKWQAQTDLVFLKSSLPWDAGYDIGITFGTLVNYPQTFDAETTSPAGGGDITVNSAKPWATTGLLPTVLLHEIGHALGLRHSELLMAAMHNPPGVTELHVDDMLGISSIYDKWTTLPGAAMDIGANASGAVWVLGTGAPGQADFPVYQWNGSGWDWDRADGWGTRITVARDGRPWVVNSEHRIFRRSNASALSGTWEEVLGMHATDIAAEAGNVWVISDQTAWGNDFKIFQWWTGSTWIESDGGAVRIGIGGSGIPWVVDAGGYIYRRTSAGAEVGTWELMPGAANDVSVSIPPFDNGFVIGTSSTPGVGSTYLWNQQVDLSNGGTTPGEPPAVSEWINLQQNGIAIAVGQNGRPWVVGPNHEILTVTK